MSSRLKLWLPIAAVNLLIVLTFVPTSPGVPPQTRERWETAYNYVLTPNFSRGSSTWEKFVDRSGGGKFLTRTTGKGAGAYVSLSRAGSRAQKGFLERYQLVTLQAGKLYYLSADAQYNSPEAIPGAGRVSISPANDAYRRITTLDFSYDKQWNKRNASFIAPASGAYRVQMTQERSDGQLDVRKVSVGELANGVIFDGDDPGSQWLGQPGFSPSKTTLR